MVILIALVAMFTLGIPRHPDNSDITGTIRKVQKSNSGKRVKIITLCGFKPDRGRGIYILLLRYQLALVVESG
jgi:hypothetical protein